MRMNDSPRVIFVLGAGASKPFNLPVSSDLKKDIIANPTVPLSEDEQLRGFDDYVQAVGKRLTQAFTISGQYSIDAFLEDRDDKAELEYGRRLIAGRLLPKEANAVAEPSIASDWYQWLFNQLIMPGKRKLSFEDVHFVTFNYDRTLEMALATMAFNAFRLTADDAIHLFNDVPITHVYGKLAGRVAFDDQSGHFRVSTSQKAVHLSGEAIRIISDHRDGEDSSDLSKAISLLHSANTVVFLGFSFDERNLHRIGIGPKWERWNNAEISVLASAYGRGRRERENDRALLGHGARMGEPSQDCLMFLREHVPLRESLRALRTI
jgi:hypothetical protein